ncbi:MAG: acyltransferase family protein, partial [Actinobacteria bacterium]|nr:acyltransferase family protein [Actinomycetota bacterium]
VLLYHAGLAWIPGGFLGVEVFFVISGYLITSLLLTEWRQRGRIDLAGFWLRRARRLLPALYLLLAVTLAFAVVFLPEEVAGLRGDAIAAFGYVINWYLVLGQESYFETVGRPSLLQHLWSLAIEEQFYVLWPLLFAAGISFGIKRWRRRRLLLAALVGAAASALLMAFLYRPDVDPSRLYYGTDTRAAGLLIGAALAFVWAPGRVPDSDRMDCLAAARHIWPHNNRWLGRLRRRWSWIAPLLLDALGLAALGGLVWFCLRLDETQPFLFRGGFALVALTTAVLIMVVVHPRARLGAGLLGRWPLRWLGLRSYGIYLWHWPVFMVTRPELDVPIDGLPLLALRLATTVMLAALSYRYVETPIRRGALGRAWKTLSGAREAPRWQRAGWAGAVGTGVVSSVMLGVALATAQPPATPSYLSVEAVHTEAPAAPLETPDTRASATKPETKLTGALDTRPGTSESTTRTTPSGAPAGVPAPTGRVTAIGDSVMVGAAGELVRALGNPEIDAEVSRQAPAATEILRKRRAAGQLGDVVVIHIGNNGPFSAEQFDELMRVLEGVRRVVFVNVKVPRHWEQPNNSVLADGVQRYPNAVLVDWHAASAGHPEFFVEDGHHLQIEGQRVYADLIAAHLEAS